MGTAIGARLSKAGNTVLWHPAGRSAATRDRAAHAGLQPVHDIAELLTKSEVVLSVCPAAIAGEVAHVVASRDYRGIYVDANAISPNTMRRISQLFNKAV